MRAATTLVCLLVGHLWISASAQDGRPGGEADILALEQMMDEYFALLVEGDGQALATYYTRDAVVATNTTVVVGREAIADAFDTLRTDPAPALYRDSLQLLSDTVAVAHGRFTIGGASGRYLRVFLKQDGQWRVARLQTSP